MIAKKIDLPLSWLAHLEPEFSKEYMLNLKSFLVKEKHEFTIYPPGALIFNALKQTPFDTVKAIILGQDPYHGPNQAHGLCFSVQRGVKPPPSLVNIYKELHSDLNLERPRHGDLTSWAQQGVLLLNTTLTVRAGSPKSHAKQGWETFTDTIIKTLNDHKENLVFFLWGAHAHSKEPLIDAAHHLILKSVHPSPLSAHRGFLGCRHFSQCNDYLQSKKITPINWQIPE